MLISLSCLSCLDRQYHSSCWQLFRGSGGVLFVWRKQKITNRRAARAIHLCLPFISPLVLCAWLCASACACFISSGSRHWGPSHSLLLFRTCTLFLASLSHCTFLTLWTFLANPRWWGLTRKGQTHSRKKTKVCVCVCVCVCACLHVPGECPPFPCVL